MTNEKYLREELAKFKIEYDKMMNDEIEWDGERARELRKNITNIRRSLSEG